MCNNRILEVAFLPRAGAIEFVRERTQCRYRGTQSSVVRLAKAVDNMPMRASGANVYVDVRPELMRGER